MCCRALTNCVVYRILSQCSEFIYCSPASWWLCALHWLKKWPLALTSWGPVCVSSVSQNRPQSCSHENSSVYAEIRGLLKFHLNSSQAPLVAYSSISGGHGRRSYWLILTHFKWVTKSEAWHNARCNISMSSFTLAQPFRVTNSSLWSLWGHGKVIFQTPPYSFSGALLIAHVVH